MLVEPENPGIAVAINAKQVGDQDAVDTHSVVTGLFDVNIGTVCVADHGSRGGGIAKIGINELQSTDVFVFGLRFYGLVGAEGRFQKSLNKNKICHKAWCVL